MSNFQPHDLEAVLAVLTPKIQEDLPAWYGAKTELAGLPTFHSREWSFFFHYPIQISENQKEAVLVKIRHLEKMGIAEAIINKKIKEEMRHEYESLVKIRTIFTKQAESPLFSAIRPLAYYEDLNAIVMERAHIRTLKSYFQAPSMWMEGKSRRKFESYLEITGRWLRLFHDQMGRMEKGPLFSESFYEDAHENLNKIEVSSGRLDLSFVKVLIDDLYRSYRKANLPYRILHGDFSSANIFVTCDGKICAVDPHNEPAPLYLDLAKIITDLETRRIQILTNGMSVPRSRLKIFNSSLLNGYFSADPVNYFALNLFRLLLLIEKWAENEVKLQRMRGKSRFLYSLGVSQMRRYLLSLLHKQVYEQDYGL